MTTTPQCPHPEPIPTPSVHNVQRAVKHLKNWRHDTGRNQPCLQCRKGSSPQRRMVLPLVRSCVLHIAPLALPFCGAIDVEKRIGVAGNHHWDVYIHLSTPSRVLRIVFGTFSCTLRMLLIGIWQLTRAYTGLVRSGVCPRAEREFCDHSICSESFCPGTSARQIMCVSLKPHTVTLLTASL